jgi:hypothetical protein
MSPSPFVHPMLSRRNKQLISNINKAVGEEKTK